MSAWIDPTSGKHVWVVGAESCDDWPDPPPWSSAGFGLLLAAERFVDAAPLAERAVAQGLAFASAWGPACTMVEDVFDETIVDTGNDESADDVVLTTSHPDESLEETLEFFLDAATAAPGRAAACDTWVIFALGPSLLRRVERALQKRGATRESDERKV